MVAGTALLHVDETQIDDQNETDLVDPPTIKETTPRGAKVREEVNPKQG